MTIEIRLCRAKLVDHIVREAYFVGDWVEATPEARLQFEAVVEAGCRQLGAGTHWIEERRT